MDVFLQEHGKTVFIAVCILLLVGVAYARLLARQYRM